MLFSGLGGEINASPHLGDLIKLFFEPIDVGILVLEDTLQKRLRSSVTNFIGQMNGFVIAFDCTGFGIQVRLDLKIPLILNGASLQQGAFQVKQLRATVWRPGRCHSRFQ
jgi:hypothetical protein